MTKAHDDGNFKVFTMLVVFLSSYAPLALFLAAQNVRFCNGSWSIQHFMTVLWLLGISAVSVAYSLCFLYTLPAGSTYVVKDVTNRSNELVNYSLPYIVSFLGIQLDEPSSWLPFVLFLVLMFFLTVKTQSVFVNPIFALVGYALYEVDVEKEDKTTHMIIMAKGSIVLGEKREILPLTPFLGLAK